MSSKVRQGRQDEKRFESYFFQKFENGNLFHYVSYVIRSHACMLDDGGGYRAHGRRFCWYELKKRRYIEKRRRRGREMTTIRE
jgi:hypothetical protein